VDASSGAPSSPNPPSSGVPELLASIDPLDPWPLDPDDPLELADPPDPDDPLDPPDDPLALASGLAPPEPPLELVPVPDPLVPPLDPEGPSTPLSGPQEPAAEPLSPQPNGAMAARASKPATALASSGCATLRMAGLFARSPHGRAYKNRALLALARLTGAVAARLTTFSAPSVYQPVFGRRR